MQIDRVLRLIKRLIPRRLFRLAQPSYHRALAVLGAILYRFPARSMTVIGVTGTKGKSSTCEYLNAILEAAGKKTVLISTIRIKVGDESHEERRHMTMPGRFVIQRTLARALRAGCTHAIIEISSEGHVQSRDRFLELDCLIFTNLAPEHIEAHGSFEAYAAAKLGIAGELAKSGKRPRIIVANADDAYGARFLETPVEHAIPFRLADAEPYVTTNARATFSFAGEQVHLRFPGEFSIMNALAAGDAAAALGISLPDIVRGLEGLALIPGRAQNIAEGRDFAVIIDYAHTAESLKALYEAYDGRRRICVLGGTGGGRDAWKRPAMGAVADEYCAHVILTDEDPYDEDPEKIVAEVAAGVTKKQPEIILDRRLAIRRALSLAAPGDAILITGKGSNSAICGPNGTLTPWSDADVAREELAGKDR
ncbi:MAG TPA: UDP-N-acetylmuramyl-tripeptide synthetase [Candidatus Paceibacterota bacterium]|nr:UDP-N-acetylmuramyl-tripeptide synthetase [Candidatus Paceibacterota bacterium]